MDSCYRNRKSGRLPYPCGGRCREVSRHTRRGNGLLSQANGVRLREQTTECRGTVIDSWITSIDSLPNSRAASVVPTRLTASIAATHRRPAVEHSFPSSLASCCCTLRASHSSPLCRDTLPRWAGRRGVCAFIECCLPLLLNLTRTLVHMRYLVGWRGCDFWAGMIVWDRGQQTHKIGSPIGIPPVICMAPWSDLNCPKRNAIYGPHAVSA